MLESSASTHLTVTQNVLPIAVTLTYLDLDMFGNKSHIFTLTELASNVRITTVFQQITELPSEQVQNHDSFQEMLWNGDNIAYQFTITNSPEVTDRLSDSGENHSGFLDGHHTDIERTYQNERTANDTPEVHCSNTESSSQQITSKDVYALDSFSKSPENHTICLAGRCFYVDLTDLNTKTAFYFVEHYPRSHDSLWGDRKLRSESIVEENISVKADKLTIVIAHEN